MSQEREGPGTESAAAGGPGVPPGKHAIKPLPFDPRKLHGLSERLIVSHHENNYAGALKNLNKVEEELAKMGDVTSAYADALSQHFGKNFGWYNPKIKVRESGGKKKVILTIPSYKRTMAVQIELGPTAAEESERIQKSVRDYVQARIGDELNKNPKQFATVYQSEKDYLVRHAKVPEYCFSPNDPSRSSLLLPPSGTSTQLKGEVSSIGRKDGDTVVGFEKSRYKGPSGVGTDASVSDLWGNPFWNPGSFGGMDGMGMGYVIPEGDNYTSGAGF